MTKKLLLILAALANFAIALLHVILPFVGAAGYVYFGAADLAVLDAQGSLVPEMATWFLALVFAGFGFYCLSGAGTIRRLPLLNPVLWFAGGIYTLRGLIFFLDLLGLFLGAQYPLRQMVFSAVALVVGLLILVGTGKNMYLKNNL